MNSSRSAIILFWRFLLIDKNKNNNIKTKPTIKPTHLWYVKPSLFNFPEHKAKECVIFTWMFDVALHNFRAVSRSVCQV